MGKVHLLCIALTLASVGAYNKYEGGQYLSIFLNISENIFVLNNITIILRQSFLDAMAKYKKWQEKHGGNLQIRSFDYCHFSFLVKISRRNSKGGVKYVGNCITSGTLVLIFCYIFQC